MSILLKDSREYTRYSIVPGSQLATETASEPPMSNLTLIDISRSGARLTTSSSPDYGDRVVLNFGHINEAVVARVSWIARDVNQGWIFGCEFLSELTEETILEFTDKHQIDRRIEPRRAVNCSAAVRSLRTPSLLPIRIDDISRGGFRASATSMNVDQGCHVVVSFPGVDGDETSNIHGEVKWRKKLEDGTTAFGCSFVEPTDYRKMQDAMQRVKEISLNEREMAVAWVTGTPDDSEPTTRWNLVAVAVTFVGAMSQQLFG